MSGVTVLASSYRRAPSTSDARGVCKALRECASCRDFPIEEERSPHLWRGDRSNLVADQLPAGRHFCEHEAAMELAGCGFPAVLLLNRGPIDRDRYIAVNPKSWPRRRPDSASIDGTTKQMRRGPNLTA